MLSVLDITIQERESSAFFFFSESLIMEGEKTAWTKYLTRFLQITALAKPFRNAVKSKLKEMAKTNEDKLLGVSCEEKAILRDQEWKRC